MRKTFFRLKPFITDLLFPPSGRNHVSQSNGRLGFKTLCDQLFGEVTFDHFFHQFLSRASIKEKITQFVGLSFAFGISSRVAPIECFTVCLAIMRFTNRVSIVAYAICI